MKEYETHNGERCTYCGRFRDANEDICECGKGIMYAIDDNDRGFYWGEMNSIDDILESKRVRQ